MLNFNSYYNQKGKTMAENPVLDYVKGLFALGETARIPGLRDVVLNMVSHKRYEKGGFDIDHITDAEMPRVIDFLINHYVNDQAFLTNLFISLPQEKINQFPLDFLKNVFLLQRNNIGATQLYLDKILKTQGINDGYPEGRSEEDTLTYFKQLSQEHEDLRDILNPFINEFQVFTDIYNERLKYGEPNQRKINNPTFLENMMKIAQTAEANGAIASADDFIANRMGMSPNDIREYLSQVEEQNQQNNTSSEPNSSREQSTTAKFRKGANKTAKVKSNTALLSKVQDIFKQADENGLIISETVMLACGLSQDEIELVSQQGLKEVSNIIQQKIDQGALTDEQFLQKLFSLDLNDLQQLPISFLADIAKSKALKTFGKDEQEYIFSAIFKTLGIDDVQDIANMEAEKVAYNHQNYKDIFKAYVGVNIEFAQQRKDDEANYLIENKLQEMLDKAPVLTNNAKQLKNFTPYKGVNGQNSNLEENTEAVLALFEDSKEITKDKINALGLDQGFDQYFSNTAARAGLAQYKLGAYAEAAKAKGLIKKNQSTENFSVVDPAEKNSPVNKYVNTIKNVAANFVKPQNVAKMGFRTVATQAIQHFTEGAIPGIGAAVGLAMKLGECAKKIHYDKQKPSEVFKAALPDLARGVITVGASFTPIAPVAGLIGSVASVAVKGIQAAHEEGLTFGHGFMTRIAKEFTKKGNLLNLAASTAGTVVGIEARKAGGLGALWDKIRGHGDEQEVTTGIAAGVEARMQTEALDEFDQTTAEVEDVEANLDDNTNVYIDENGHLRGVDNHIAETQTELSYAEQYIQDHPGAHFDKNGWVQNADGSYPKNEQGQLFGNEERVFRNLRENETLDKAGNIVEQPKPEPKWVFGEPVNKGKEISVEEAYFQELAKKTDDLKNLVKASGKEITPDAVDAMLGEMEKVVVENPSFEPEYEQMKAAAEVLKQQSASVELPPESVNYHPAGNVVDESTVKPVVETKITPVNEYAKTAATLKNNTEWLKEYDPNQYNEKIGLYEIQEKMVPVYEKLADNNLSAVEREQALRELTALNVEKENWLKKEQFGIEPSTNEARNQAQVNRIYERIREHDQDVLQQAQKVTENIAVAEPTQASQSKPEVYVEEEYFRNLQNQSENITVEESASQPIPEFEQAAPEQSEPQVQTKQVVVESNVDEQMRDFKSLPLKQQRDLINIKARGEIARANGDVETYSRLHDQFNEKFDAYVEDDKRLDLQSQRANIPGTEEYDRRELAKATIALADPKFMQENVEKFQEAWGEDSGIDPKTGIRLYERRGGGLDLEQEVKNEIARINARTQDKGHEK